MIDLDPRNLLAKPNIFAAFSSLLSRRDTPGRVVDLLEIRADMRVLDLGCGPARILEAMPAGVDYCGIDCSESYLAAAKTSFGDRATFISRTIDPDISFADLGQFDRIIANGLVHHLADESATAMFEAARNALRPGGSIATLDPVLIEEQNFLARWLINLDRGNFVRQRGEYEALARTAFGTLDVTVITDMLRVPYTHILMRYALP